MTHTPLHAPLSEDNTPQLQTSANPTGSASGQVNSEPIGLTSHRVSDDEDHSDSDTSDHEEPPAKRKRANSA